MKYLVSYVFQVIFIQLAGIIRSSSLADVARGSTQIKYEGMDNHDPADGPSAPPFYQFVHDEFLHKLAQHVIYLFVFLCFIDK